MRKEDLTLDQQWMVAGRLAADRLPSINAKLDDVRVADGFYARYGKRALDVVCASIGCIVTLPINLVLGVITFFDVGRPILFKQTRIGKNEKPFTLVKFRNMRNLYDERGELLNASERVTEFGKFVRKTSLDELLNFWSVLKGDMSLIGPRPLVAGYTPLYHKRHKGRLLVRPGLECPPRELTGEPRTWQERLENDVWYVEHVSFRTDCRMLVNLFKFALDSKNAAARADAEEDGTFLGYTEEGIAVTLSGVPQEYVDACAKEYGWQ